MWICFILLTATQPYTAYDQVTMRRVSNLAPSPDGRFTAFALRSTDYAENKARYDIWLAANDGSGARALTTHPDNETDPQWSQNHVYYLRGGQVWRINVNGGEGEQVTKLPLDVEAYRVSSTGTLVVAMETFVDCPDAACTAQRQEDKKKSKATGQLYDKLFIRHWDAWASAGKRRHWFTATGKDLMSGVDMNAPTLPFGDAREATFTPDGKSLVYTARVPGKLEATSTNLDLFVVSLQGGAAKNLTQDNLASDSQPAFSPDGRWLAYLAAVRPGYEADKDRLMLREWATGKTSDVTGDIDHSIASFSWAADSRSVIAVAAALGEQPLFVVNLAAKTMRKSIGGGHVGEVATLKDGRAVYTFDDLKHPADLYIGTQAITQVNAEALQRIAFGDYEQFSFTGAGGDTVYGYMVKPVGFDPTKTYPLAFFIHGGPQSSMSNLFHYRWNPQVYAARGYVSVMIDFHGSTGYGQKFTDSISGDWGGKPLEDLQKGFAAAAKRYPFIDTNRACALGASYGGFMINWIAGNWPDRFKCLVNHDGNLDERLAYYDTEELWFPEWEHGGTPWDNPQGYAKHNPIDHVTKWKTPMLVVHGGRDYRVVDTQGISTFTLLQRRGIPSKFLYFPDENHWVLKPQNSVQWHDTVLRWLDQWTALQ